MEKTLKFKTNINCSSCEATVTPFLDGDDKVIHWEVDTTQKDKILTITTDGSAEEVIATVKKAGFNAENIS